MSRYTARKNIVTLVACLLFCIFVFGYEIYVRRQAETAIQQHARIVADALWNINRRGAFEYLNLAVVTHNYTNITVFEESGAVFHAIDGPQRSKVDRFFEQLGLTPEVQLSSEVSSHKTVIGRVEATWLPWTVYTHINVLFAIGLITAVLHLYLRVREDKDVLENRVRRRTNELEQANRALLQEVHQKKRSSANLRRSEEEYRHLYRESKSAEELYKSLIDSSADGIVIADLNGEISYVSTTFTEMFGYSLDEVRKRHLEMFVPENREAVERVLQDVRINGTSYHAHEIQGLHRNGNGFDISVSGSRFNDHSGIPTGILLVIRDISHNKKLERQLQRAERLEAVGTLAGGIAHDFNNLLMGVLGNVSLALVETGKSSQVHQRLKNIETYIRSGQELTGQLLGFARGGKYEVKPTDLNNLIHEEIMLFSRTRKDLSFTEDYQEQIWATEVDRGQIRQVLLNLFVNAGQAMEENGEIRVATHNVELEAISTGTYRIPAGNYIRISVSDSGHGMDKQTQARIFDPFFTTKGIGRGTGLGLASAYGIIKNHSGFIDVSSEVGAGTTFTIYLPLTEKELHPQEKKQDDLPAMGQGKILLVDDEDMILDIGREMLMALGYEVVTAESGDEACRIFTEHSGGFDLVILDMIMPGMDGGMVFDRLLDIAPGAKILLSSGYSLNGRAMEIMDRGCAGFLQKPFDIRTLSAKVRDILSGNAAEHSQKQ